MTALIVFAGLLVVLLLYREHLSQLERREWTRERGQLLNRIKPETAQPDTGGPEPELFQPPAWDSDAEYWETRKESLN